MISITATNLSDAWIQTLGAVLDAGGTAVNVITSWEADNEQRAVRGVLDTFIRTRPNGKKKWPRYTAETVANTIFADELYEPSLGTDALSQFSALYLEGYEISHAASPGGEYCHRLVAWDAPEGGKVNQLEEVARRLRKYADPTNVSYRFSSDYELAIEHPVLDLRTQMPGRNGTPYGFPCLSHISLTIHNSTVHMTALYRNQHLIKKAYGNYLGLSRLGRALCHHAGLDLGTITVIATHADAEIGTAKGFGKLAIEAVHADAIEASANCPEGLILARTRQIQVATEETARELVGPATTVGVDVVDIGDFADDINSDEYVLDAMFTSSEQAECLGDAHRLASRFALKEATLKVLGTGIRGLDVLDVIVSTAPDGRPSLQLSELASERAVELRLDRFRCSTTRDAGLAIGIVVATEVPVPSSATATATGTDPRQETS